MEINIIYMEKFKHGHDHPVQLPVVEIGACVSGGVVGTGASVWGGVVGTGASVIGWVVGIGASVWG